MVTVTLTELDLNAIGAALDERSLSLGRNIRRLATDPPSRDREFALEANREAMRDTIRARLLLAAAVEEPEYPEGMTFGALAEAL